MGAGQRGSGRQGRARKLGKPWRIESWCAASGATWPNSKATALWSGWGWECVRRSPRGAHELAGPIALRLHGGPSGWVSAPTPSMHFSTWGPQDDRSRSRALATANKFISRYANGAVRPGKDGAKEGRDGEAGKEADAEEETGQVVELMFHVPK